MNNSTITTNDTPAGQSPALGLVSGSGSVAVAAILPLWRYAVGPASGRSAAIPYYGLASAMAFFDEARRELPWAGVILYRRRWFRVVEVLKEYVPNNVICNSHENLRK